MATPKDTAPPPARLSTSLDRLADRLEFELHRLREKRPALSDRIDRASAILVTHLACPRSRTIRVRVAANGQPTFLVKGSHGNVYSVNPIDWSCTCPDHHRRDAACKHGLACYILRRASLPARRLRTCCGCDRRFPRGEIVEVQEEHENLTYFPGDSVCLVCADRAGVLR